MSSTTTDYTLSVYNGDNSEAFPPQTFATLDDALVEASHAMRDEKNAKLVTIDIDERDADGELVNPEKAPDVIYEWDAKTESWDCTNGKELAGDAN